MLTLPRREESNLRCYTSWQIDEVWCIYKPHIQRALDRGSNYTIDEVYEGLKKAEMQLWTYGQDAALVTTIQSRDDKTWCLLLALGGSKMDEWKGFLPHVDEWAKSKGCSELRIYGRIGWKRLGFDVEYTKLVRKL